MVGMAYREHTPPPPGAGQNVLLRMPAHNAYILTKSMATARLAHVIKN
jgi:hypothetical protein